MLNQNIMFNIINTLKIFTFNLKFFVFLGPQLISKINNLGMQKFIILPHDT